MTHNAIGFLYKHTSFPNCPPARNSQPEKKCAEKVLEISFLIFPRKIHWTLFEPKTPFFFCLTRNGKNKGNLISVWSSIICHSVDYLSLSSKTNLTQETNKLTDLAYQITHQNAR